MLASWDANSATLGGGAQTSTVGASPSKSATLNVRKASTFARSAVVERQILRCTDVDQAFEHGADVGRVDSLCHRQSSENAPRLGVGVGGPNPEICSASSASSQIEARGDRGCESTRTELSNATFSCHPRARALAPLGGRDGPEPRLRGATPTTKRRPRRARRAPVRGFRQMISPSRRTSSSLPPCRQRARRMATGMTTRPAPSMVSVSAIEGW